MKKVIFCLCFILVCGSVQAHEKIEGIDIEGSAAFIKRTREAFTLLRKTSSFQEIKPFIAVIKEGERSGMHANQPRPTYEVGGPTWRHSAMWFAGSIVHDGYHSKLYHEGKTWTGKQAEIECLKIQARALKEMKADRATIAYVENLQKNPTYQGDGSMEDYKKRSW